MTSTSKDASASVGIVTGYLLDRSGQVQGLDPPGAVLLLVSLVIVAGAVYNPLVVTVPTAGASDQVTAVLVEPVTVLLNCCVCPDVSVAVVGDTETAAPAYGGSGTWTMLPKTVPG